MPTTDVTNSLVAAITCTEQSTSNVPINRGTGNPAFLSNAGVFVTYASLNAGVNVVSLPVNPVFQLYVKNIDPSGSFSVTWTPQSNPSAYILDLNPGDQIIFWCNPAGSAVKGITALSFIAAAGPTLCEYFIGG